MSKNPPKFCVEQLPCRSLLLPSPLVLHLVHTQYPPLKRGSDISSCGSRNSSTWTILILRTGLRTTALLPNPSPPPPLCHVYLRFLPTFLASLIPLSNDNRKSVLHTKDKWDLHSVEDIVSNKSIHMYNGVPEYFIMRKLSFCHCCWELLYCSQSTFPCTIWLNETAQYLVEKKYSHERRCWWFVSVKESSASLLCSYHKRKHSLAFHLVSEPRARFGESRLWKVCKIIRWPIL